MRLGIFGGSFDPVHNGHLRLAECCAEQADLEAVWFVPAAVQPHKPTGPVASDVDRVAMLRLALAEHPKLGLSLIEIDRGGVSYTIETLRELRLAHPEAELFFLMGADTLADLPLWREPEEVLRLMTPLVVQRPGEPSLDSAIPHTRVEMPPVDISSSELRERVRRGESIRGMVPSEVEAYLLKERLYASAS
ncbi:MAG: nicotinate-nucleotide adenylyltransferase [Planctomycetota bacterium]